MVTLQVLVVVLFIYAGVKVSGALFGNPPLRIQPRAESGPAETMMIEHHVHHFSQVATGEQVERQLPDGTVIRTQKVTRWN